MEQQLVFVGLATGNGAEQVEPADDGRREAAHRLLRRGLKATAEPIGCQPERDRLDLAERLGGDVPPCLPEIIVTGTALQEMSDLVDVIEPQISAQQMPQGMQCRI